ncbi:retrovirus-related pol polyprotein from transposon TNT 1-94 [Tanacetum coccineum]
MEAIRIFLAFATYMNFKVYQMDVKSAFLNGKLKEEVYVKQPPSFESNEFPDYVCKLNKALYEMKQAPRVWYETLSTFLIQNKFTKGRIDITLFIYKLNGDVILVQVYVDDIIFGSTSYKLFKQFEKLMTKKFEISMIGELTYFLRRQIKQDDKGITIFQEQYTRNLLKKYEISDCFLVKTPMVPLNNLGPNLAGKPVNKTSYRGMIKSLMYLTVTRPDIRFSIVLCARYQSNPKESHLTTVKRILKYLKEKEPRVPAKYLVENWFVGVLRNSIMDPSSSIGKTCLEENVIEISSDKAEGHGDWNSPKYRDTANSGGKRETKAIIFHKMETEEISDKFVAPCFVNGLEAYDGEINLAIEENMISNEFAVKLCLDYEEKSGHKVVKKELIVALRGEIYFVKFILNLEEDDVEPGVVFGRSFLRLTRIIADFGTGTVTIYPELDMFLESSIEEEKIVRVQDGESCRNKRKQLENYKLTYSDIGCVMPAQTSLDIVESDSDDEEKLWEHTMMRLNHQYPNALHNTKPWRRYCSHKFIMNSYNGKVATEMQSLELCHEFYSTYEFDKVSADDELKTKKIIKFRLGGHAHRGLRSDEHFNAQEYWLSISREENLSLSRSHAATIRNPVLRVLHKMITYGLYQKKTREKEWVLRERESMTCCGQFITKIARKARVLSDEVIRSLSAPIYCRDLDTTTLRELIDFKVRLIPEAPQPDVPRVAIPRPTRASMQDLYDWMGSMEIRHGTIERMAYK